MAGLEPRESPAASFPQPPCSPWADLWEEDDWVPCPPVQFEEGANVEVANSLGQTTSLPFTHPLSQDVKAAVEEIDSIVNELWRTALPPCGENTSPVSAQSNITFLSVSPNRFNDCQSIYNSSEIKDSCCNKEVSGIKFQGSPQRENKPKHKCDRCDKSYTWVNDLVKHKKIHSSERHHCPVCNKIYVLKSDLCKHERSHKIEKSFVCKYCKKSFISSGDLHKHIRIHTGERPYSCDVCKKSFSASDNFSKHLKIHSGLKPLICLDCGQRFMKKSNLQQHSRIHLGEKPFQCETCGLSFTQKTHLKSHMNTHNGVKPFVCSNCEQHFTRNADLKRHILRVHSLRVGNRGL